VKSLVIAVAVPDTRGMGAETSARVVILVEGESDRTAVEAVARRLGRDLRDEGVSVEPMGGATNVRRFLERFGPRGLAAEVRGLCDAGEARYVARALHHAGVIAGHTMTDLAERGFHVCDVDLEDELIRAVGVERVETVLADQGELGSFRVMQRQPAQRGRLVEQQLRRFIACGSGRKTRYARALVEAVEVGRVPQPLQAVLATG
jgi:hypothetical protein